MNVKIKQRLSQGQLNQLTICPPLFQRNYLKQLNLPTTPEQLERLDWGSRFHLLMQQRELGLSIDAFADADSEMGRSLYSLQSAAPDLFQSDNDTWREAEHQRTICFHDYLFTVIYDLLIITEEKAQIIDWKTYPLPENSQKLVNNWQTRLYLYVLAETSDYQPEDISLTYWFVKLPQKAQFVTFNYSQCQHQQTQQDLAQLLSNLDQWLATGDFPHRDECQSSCPYYSSLVGDHKLVNPSQTIAEIPEISLD